MDKFIVRKLKLTLIGRSYYVNVAPSYGYYCRRHQLNKVTEI